MVKAGINRVWVEPLIELLPEQDKDGLQNLFAEWEQNADLHVRITSVGPYDGSITTDNPPSMYRPWARSAYVRTGELAAPGWQEDELTQLEGAEAIISYVALMQWVDMGRYGEHRPSETLINVRSFGAKLNLLRAWKDADGRWRPVPTERLIRLIEPGIGLDQVNSLYLLFDGPPLPLSASSKSSELEGLYTIADFQLRGELNELPDAATHILRDGPAS